MRALGWMALALTATGMAVPAAADDAKERLAAALAPLFKKPPTDGLLVYEVLPRMQAEKAGLRVGDILTHYDGKAVRTVGQLQGLARTAAHENRGNLLVVARRLGGETFEATFDAAPMGVRLVAVNPAESRVLRRPATPYEPNWEPLRRQAALRHSFGFLSYGDKLLGWSHSYLQELSEGRFVLRTQSYTKTGPNPELRDASLVFAADRATLRPLAIRSTTNGKSALNVALQGLALRGDRFGVPDAAALPDDALAAELAGFVAASMPRAKDACLHCSYLPSGALAAAPFADLCCLGPDRVFNGRQNVMCHLYDQTEFGRSMALLWIDHEGVLAKAKLGGGAEYYRAGSADLGKEFPNWANAFPPIEQLPELAGAARLGN